MDPLMLWMLELKAHAGRAHNDYELFLAVGGFTSSPSPIVPLKVRPHHALGG